MNCSATQRSRPSQRAFKDDLIAHHNASCAQDSNFIRCLVTWEYVRKDLCIAAHILPHNRQMFLPVFNIPGLLSIDDVQNGFLWAQRIEEAYTANEVCMIYNPFISKLVFVVLRADLLQDALNVSNLTFGDVHCKQLQVAPDKLPNLRLLLNQAMFAMKHAIEQGWPQSPNHGDISRMLDAMNDVVSRMVTDCDDDSSEVLQKWADENPSFRM